MSATLTALELHAARLRSHLTDVRALLDESAGLSALLPSSDSEFLSLHWHLERTKARLTRCLGAIAQEKTKTRSTAA